MLHSDIKELPAIQQLSLIIWGLICIASGIYYLTNPSSLLICLLISSGAGVVLGLINNWKSKTESIICAISFACASIVFSCVPPYYIMARKFSLHQWEWFLLLQAVIFLVPWVSRRVELYLRSLIEFPVTMDLASAKKLARQGGNACVIQIVMILMVFSTFNSLMPNQISFLEMFAPRALIYVLSAITIYRMSRIGAVIGLLVYVQEQMLIFLDGRIPGENGIFPLFMCFLFLNGIRGTFAYHRIRKERQADIDRPEEVSVSE